MSNFVIHFIIICITKGGILDNGNVIHFIILCITIHYVILHCGPIRVYKRVKIRIRFEYSFILYILKDTCIIYKYNTKERNI